MASLQLRESDRVEITVVVHAEGGIYVGGRSEVVQPPSPTAWAPLTESGLSLGIKVFSGRTENLVLLDAGRSGPVLLNNLGALNLAPETIERVFLSRGRPRHAGGLEALRSQKPGGLDVVASARAVEQMRDSLGDRLGDGPTRPGPESAGLRLHPQENPALWCSDQVLTMAADQGRGPIDEQTLVLNIKDRGLAVVGGCFRAGLTQTLDRARNLTGVDRIFAVIGALHPGNPDAAGGFRPAGRAFDGNAPDYLVLTPCGPWTALNDLFCALPGRVFLLGVGGRSVLSG